MSGGVDSAVAALLVRARGRRGGRGHARAVGRRRERRRASCCSAQRRPPARALAHRMGLPHFTLDLREEFRAGVVDAVPRRPRRRADARTRACAATATSASTRCSSSPTASAPPRWPPATTRAARADGAAARRRRPGQGPELHARRPRARVARAPALPARRADQARGPRARGRGRPARRAQDRLPGPVLPRRHGAARPSSPATAACASAPARSSTAPAACSAATAATTTSRSASAGGSASGGGAALRARDRRAREPVLVGPREALATHEVAVRDAILHRDAARVDRVKLRYRSRPCPCRRRSGERAGRRCTCTSRSSAPRRDRPPCLDRRRGGRRGDDRLTPQPAGTLDAVGESDVAPRNRCGSSRARSA